MGWVSTRFRGEPIVVYAWSMNVTLPVELEQMVKEKVESGEYGSAGEVVRDALQLLVLSAYRDLESLF